MEGVAIERAAQMTNWDYYEAALRFQRILRAMGISDALREEGVEEGDTVSIGARRTRLGLRQRPRRVTPPSSNILTEVAI